jgi:hypothetical protein
MSFEPSSPTRPAIPVPEQKSPQYNRYKYYEKLKTTHGHITGTVGAESVLTLPKHMVDAYLPGWLGAEDNEKKHGSIVNIFSTWNAMCGSGLTTMPWAF